MTTICSDGKTIAADSQKTGSYGVKTTGFIKIIKREGRIFALTGTASLLEPTIIWYLAGADPKALPVCTGNDSWMLLVIETDGLARSYSHNAPYPEPQPYPMAIGSGYEMALGAMYAGATPRRAIEIVSDNTNHTGGPIAVLTIGEERQLAEAAE